METLNKKQATKLFDSNSIYIDGIDVIPEKTAIDILGAEPCKYAKLFEPMPELYYKKHTTPQLETFYSFNFAGFMTAVTHYNADLILKGDSE